MTTKKTKRKPTKKKNKQKTINNMQKRSICLFILFLSIISLLQLGTVGKATYLFIYYLFGIFSYIFLLVSIIISFYVLYNGYFPRLTTPRMVGIYLILFALIISFSAPVDHTIKGFTIFQLYQNNLLTINGGLLGAILYSIFSSLFDHLGTLIAAIFIGLVGLSLIVGKTYLSLMKTKVSDKTHKARVKHQEFIENKKTLPIFEKKKKNLFFPEHIFDSKEQNPIIKDDAIEEKEEKAEVILGKAKPIYVHNEENETINIKDVPSDIQVNIMESPTFEKEDKIDEITHEQKTVPKSYTLPPISLLNNPNIQNDSKKEAQQFALNNAKKLTNVLNEFGVHANVNEIYIGPAITKYELKLETGTRVNRISNLQDDIKLALAAKDIRIEAPIPGKAAVGVEIPNITPSMVSFKEVLKDIPDDKKDSPLLVPLGKDVTGMSVFAELNKMPHLLIAGATGSGKSVCVNSIICSILMRTKPNQVKLMLVDPKKVELSMYNGVPHLLSPVITDPKKASKALRVIVEEMERRYELFTANNTRNISGYNEMINKHNQEHPDHSKELLPFIVVILDEVADLMMVASKDVEDCIMRISQMARAAGIHLIVATQRPSTDVITGVVKANIPSRIAFAVSSSIDSRTILDASGAEKLLGKGDMLFSPMGQNMIRVQGSFVSDQEVEKIVDYISKQQEAKFEQKYIDLDVTSSSSSYDDQEDEEYEMCRDFVIRSQKASTSLLQRQFRIGYNKAARIIDQLEANGVIGPQIGSKPREVYIRGYEEE